MSNDIETLNYEETNWVNGGEPAINANNLNKLEDGLEAVTSLASTNAGNIETLNSSISSKENVSNKTTSLDLEDGEEIDTADTDTYPTVAAVQSYVVNKIAEAQLDKTEVDISGKEDKSNKQATMLTSYGASDKFYPTTGAVAEYFSQKLENYGTILLEEVSDTIDNKITNFENSWDFETLCDDVDSLKNSKEDVSNKVTAITNAGTNAAVNDTCYPTVNAVCNYVIPAVAVLEEDIETLNEEKATQSDIDTAITNFENTWDFETLCGDVDKLSKQMTADCNMIYFKKNCTGNSGYWGGSSTDVYIYFFNPVPSNFNDRFTSGSWHSAKMTLIDEENLIYAYPRLNYTHAVFSSANTHSTGFNYKTTDLLLPLPTQAKMPCFYQSPIGYDGIWGDLASNTARIYIQTSAAYLPEVSLDDTALTVYRLGIAGNAYTGDTNYYSYADVDMDAVTEGWNDEASTLSINFYYSSGSYATASTTLLEACYNHTVLYFYNSELGYYNGDVDEYFSELIGYDTSKYLS
ncbi:MAG: hypothetical protein LUF33_00085 [Clostridiales bacterium]|nr:hypothetical protein [Clostridiales bacterium]